jgi:phosphopantothenoylcysteine decarboxylase/phosphopantothenate--cysteine ligase
MRGKRILLGVTGGIAAYKIPYLIRLLKKSGAEVKCIMTPASSDFISPLVLSTLSENPVAIEFWNKSDGTWTNHVELALWADLFVVAPLTANTLAKMAIGACDNLLLATYLSMKSSTLIAPAMDLDMYAHPTTKRNLESIKSDGVGIIPPGTGELASGLHGEGRLAEPEVIFDSINAYFRSIHKGSYSGKKMMVTAGPTYEAIDPVRFIGNRSSGKMGVALAQAFANEGAEVTLITGPIHLKIEFASIHQIQVESAEEMFETVKEYWPKMNGGVFSAAVADYRPKVLAGQKIKKSAEEFTLELVKNPDILAWVGEHKSDDQQLIGFALETENLIENATSKLHRKHLDYIVMNSLQDEGAGFGVDTNKVSVLDKNNNLTSFELLPKFELAEKLIQLFSKSHL